MTEWLLGYTYRKAGKVEATTAGAQTLYPKELIIGESSGASGIDEHCNGNCINFPNDIRFTEEDGETKHDYWVDIGSLEGISPNRKVHVWIEVASVPASGDVCLYMYYGKSGDSGESDGSATFHFFDDFERGNDGDEIGGDWTEVGGIVEISTGHSYSKTRSMKLVGSGSAPKARIALIHNDNKAVLFRIYKEDAALFYARHGDGTKRQNLKITTAEDIQYVDDAGTQDTGTDLTPDAWQLLEFRDYDWAAHTFDIIYNGNSIQNDAGMVTSGLDEDQFSVVGYTTASVWIDNVLVRNYVSPEPTWGTWGSEQSEKSKASSISLTVVDLLTKASSISLTVVDLLTKASSISLTVVDLLTKTSSIGLSVQTMSEKASFISVTVVNAIPKTSSIGLTIHGDSTKESIVCLSVQNTPTKESSVALGVQDTFTKDSSAGMLIVNQKEKESDIGLTVLAETTKESSVGMCIISQGAKESSIGMYIFGHNLKHSSINLFVSEAILKRGLFYAKLGDTILHGVVPNKFRISKEINRIPRFEFEIANCETNQTAIINGISDVLEIYWQHHGEETLIFSGIINADGIEYVSLDSIIITGYASYVTLAWPFHKHLADEDAEAVDAVFDYGSSWTDYTTEANNDTINDVLVSFGAKGHRLYIGGDHPFWGLQFKYSTAGIAGDGTAVAIQYYKGAGLWAPLDVLDESTAFTEPAGTYDFIIPHPPADWTRKSMLGEKKYWLRFKITNTIPYTTPPKLDRIHIVNVDIYRTYYFDTSARAILLNVLAGTEYTMDSADSCPEDLISIIAEYESPLRLIAAIPNALTWTDNDGSKKAYQWWIDDSKKVHMKKRRGTIHAEDITGYMTIFNNHEDYFHLSNRLVGLGTRTGLSQMRAIVQDKASITTHQLREIAISKEQIGKYDMLKTALEKNIAISKDPMQRIKGRVTTEFWNLGEYEVGDCVTLHQEEWNVESGMKQIVKTEMGPMYTTLNLGISQEHLEGLKDNLQRRFDLAHVQMHGSTTMLQAGPERMNYHRVSASEVYSAKLEIEIPSEVVKTHKVLLTWTIGPYRADLWPQSEPPAGHDHGGTGGPGGAIAQDYPGLGGAHTPDVLGDGDFTPEMLSEAHKHLVDTTIYFYYNTMDIKYLDADIGHLVNGANHRHTKGRTGPPDDVGHAIVYINPGSSCASGSCVASWDNEDFAEASHWHFNSSLYTGYTEPSITLNCGDGTLITSIDPYIFSEVSDYESPAHLHDGIYEPDHDHVGVAVGTHSDHLIDAVPAHEDHIITTEPGTAIDLIYGIVEIAGGTTLELFVNGEKIGEYTTPQTELRIDGYLHKGANTIQLQPIVGQNVKGSAEIQGSGLLFVEPVKF